jgi:hypothetical protein
MRRVVDALKTTVDEASWPDYVNAATFANMRSRAAQLVPEADSDGVWSPVEGFFRSGGRRNCAALLTDTDLARYSERLARLVGPEAAPWISHTGSRSRHR